MCHLFVFDPPTNRKQIFWKYDWWRGDIFANYRFYPKHRKVEGLKNRLFVSDPVRGENLAKRLDENKREEASSDWNTSQCLCHTHPPTSM